MYVALKPFCGKISMKKGGVRDISDPVIIEDLKKAGYIEEYKKRKVRRTEAE